MGQSKGIDPTDQQQQHIVTDFFLGDNGGHAIQKTII